MPPRSRDPTTKTIYLDQSTLSDAFRSCLEPPTASAAYQPLNAWIGRVAREANLCVSTAHILETAAFPPERTVQAERFAAWIDSLPTVWMRSMLDVIEEESDYWTKMAAGITPASEVVVFASDIEGAFSGITAEQRRSAAARPGSIHPYLDAARVLVEREREDQARHAERLAMVEAQRTNQEAVLAAGVTAEERRRDLDSKTRTEIRKVARDAVTRMNERQDADLREGPLSQSVQDKLVELVAANPKALPSWRVRRAHAMRLAERYRTLPRTEKHEKKIDGDGGDYHHLGVAAAHCQIFTCDRTVAGAIHEARVALGLPPPLSRSAYPDDGAFVAALMKEWP